MRQPIFAGGTSLPVTHREGLFCMEFYFAIRLATLLAKATGSSGMMPSRSSA